MSWSILVVDDEPMARDLLRLMLERAGFKISEAASGAEALDKIELFRPDLVLLDVMMPVMDGIAVCKTLRDDPETADLPIVMLSAKTQPTAVQDGLNAGANRYLSKLTSRKDLVQILLGILEGSEE